MNDFAGLLGIAVVAVTAENLLLSGGIGLSRILRAARRPQLLGWYSLFIGIFSVLGTLWANLTAPLLTYAPSTEALFLRPALYAVGMALFYILTAFLLRTFLTGFYNKVKAVLSPAALNELILALPFTQRLMGFDLPETICFAAGTGLAFLLVSLVLTRAFRFCEHEDMPAAFRGIPAILVYVGLLSMAVAGMTGTPLFK